MPDNIIPLRPDRTAQDRSPPEPTYYSDNIRGVAPIPADRLRAIFDPKPDLTEQLRRAELLRLSGYRPSLAEKLGEAFGSEFGAGFYCGVWAGALFTVIAAYVIAFAGGR